MNFRRQRKDNLEISLTPMIDVVFLLLIFFMVTTTFNRENQLEVNLPQASGKQSQADDVLEVAIDPTGNYYVNQHQVVNRKLETLKKAILNAAGDRKKPPLLISSDASAQHRFVIRALDAAQQLGFVHISFATQNASE